MSDAIRMLDVAQLSRALEEIRRADPENRAFADRMAASAAVRHIEKSHEDVGAAENSGEVRVDEQTNREGGRRRKSKEKEPPASERRRCEPGPEQDEGKLLDIKV